MANEKTYIFGMQSVIHVFMLSVFQKDYQYGIQFLKKMNKNNITITCNLLVCSYVFIFFFFCFFLISCFMSLFDWVFMFGPG